MAIQIISEEYGPRKPLVDCTADSLAELAGLSCAEGSTATVDGTQYTLDRTQGWVQPGSGGDGGGLLVNVTKRDEENICDKTAGEIMAVVEAGGSVVFKTEEEESIYTYTIVSNAQSNPDGYSFTAAGVAYNASSADDYPASEGK